MHSTAAKLGPDVGKKQAHGGLAVGPRERLLLCVGLFVLTLAFYSPIVHDGFVLLDDIPYILSNPPVRAGLTWATVKWSFTTFHAGYWHPVTWLSHALDCQVFGLNPAGHHYVSLLLHAGSAVLLFLLLQEATALLWPSLLVAALFAMHPVNVESVAWAAERKNVLSMFFFLLALWAYDRYARRGGVWRYAVVTILFVVGLMAKPQIITLPCVLLLWDYWPLQRMFAKPGMEGSGKRAAPRSVSYLLLEKVPLFVIVVAASILTMKAQGSADAVRTLSEFSLSARLENAIVSYARYLANLAWPIHLAPLYPHAGNSLPLWQVAISVALLLGLTAIAFRWKDRRYLAVGWFWFLGVLVPMLGIVQVGEQAMADRFVYVPMIGIAIAIVWAVWDVLEEKKVSSAWMVAPAAVAVLVLGALTFHQLSYWKDGETLWRYTLSLNQNNYMAHQDLAMALDQQGRVQEAIPEFRAAEALHEFPPFQVLSLGIYEQRNGHPQQAVELYQKVLHKSGDEQLRTFAWSQSGSANAQMKNYDQANSCYENVLRANPNDAAALVASGLLAERRRDFARAVGQLAHAAQVDPSSINYLLLAEALRQSDRPREAQLAEELAKKNSPDPSQAESSARQVELFFGYTSKARAISSQHPN